MDGDYNYRVRRRQVRNLQQLQEQAIELSHLHQLMLTSHYTQDPYRYVIFVTYTLAAIVNSLPVHTFSSINVVVQNKFKISSTEVTLNALLFTIAHPLFAVPCNWLINKKGMHLSFSIGAALVVAGVWMRLLIDEGQSIFCLLGSGLAAIGNIFILNTPSKVALNWFEKDRVSIVTFTGILATLLSITIGASIPGFLIDQNTSQDEIRQFIMYEAIIVTVPMILLAVLFREKPAQPPSKAAEAVFAQDQARYKDLLKDLFKKKQYLKLMAAMTFNYGTLTALIMILDQFLAGFGYKDSGKITSVTVASAMIVGIFSNPIFSFLLRKTKAYRGVSALNTFGGFFMTALLILGYIYRIDNIGEIVFLGGMVGFFLIPLPSILITYSSEITFPIDESSSAGYLLASSQTFGFLIGFGSISFLNKSQERSEIIGFMNMGLLFLSFCAAVWVKEDLKKWKFQQTQYEIRRSKTGLDASLIVQENALK